MSITADKLKSVGKGFALAFVVVGITVLITQYWDDARDSVFSSDPEWRNAHTLGEILVDSPEVYTRERLVNDRFRQGAWLNERLVNSDTVPIGLAGVSQARRLSELHLGLRANISTNDSVATSKGPSDSQNAEIARTPPPQNQTIAGTPTEHGRSAVDAFRDRQAYREEIRSAIIENQLDDRHDLKHTTLYKLKFDASVIPAVDHDAWGVVEITVAAPTDRIQLDGGIRVALEERALQFNDYFSNPENSIESWFDSYQRYLKRVSQQLSGQFSSLLIETAAAFDSYDSVLAR